MALIERFPSSPWPRALPRPASPEWAPAAGILDREDRPAIPPIHAPSLEQLALASDLSADLARSPADKIDTVICRILEILGPQLGADRALLLLYSNDGSLLSACQEWWNDQLEPLGKAAKSLPRSTFSKTLDTINTNPFALIQRHEDPPPDANGEETFMREHGCHSQLSFPLTSEGRILGLLCLERCRPNENWDLGGIHLAVIVSLAVAAAIDRKRSSTRLKNNQSNLNALLDGFDDYLFILDSAGRILHANPPAVMALGFPLQTLRRKTLADIVPPGQSRSVIQWLADNTQGNASTSFLPLVTSEGVHIPVESKVAMATWNNHPVWLAVSRDITDRIQALDGLRRYQAQTLSILEAIPDTIIRLRHDGSIIDWMRATDPTSTTPLLADLPKISSSCREAIKKTVDDGEMQVMEVEFEKDGTTQTLECRFVAFGEEEILGVIRDVSQRAHLEQMKTDFINRASHDLRTPLTTARLMVELIQDGGTDDEIEEYWRILDQELLRQNELINTMLTVGRLERGILDLTFSPQDAGGILKQSIGEIVHTAGRKGVAITTSIPPSLPVINADRSALQRTFTNLLDNAVKYTPPGGTVRLEAQEVSGRISIAIIDSGIGIPPEDIPHLFNRFFRAGNAIREEIPGTGVGLFVVKSIIEAHHGSISVESRLDHGTTFSVWFPIQRFTQRTGEPTPPPETLGGAA